MLFDDDLEINQITPSEPCLVDLRWIAKLLFLVSICLLFNQSRPLISKVVHPFNNSSLIVIGYPNFLGGPLQSIVDQRRSDGVI